MSKRNLDQDMSKRIKRETFDHISVMSALNRLKTIMDGEHNFLIDAIPQITVCGSQS